MILTQCIAFGYWWFSLVYKPSNNQTWPQLKLQRTWLFCVTLHLWSLLMLQDYYLFPGALMKCTFVALPRALYHTYAFSGFCLIQKGCRNEAWTAVVLRQRFDMLPKGNIGIYLFCWFKFSYWYWKLLSSQKISYFISSVCSEIPHCSSIVIIDILDMSLCKKTLSTR